MNLPNRLTVLRLILACIYFALLTFAENKGIFNPALLDIALGLFIVAIITDILDGYLARKYNLVTNFGRIADPFVDKVLICGTFVFFVEWSQLREFMPAWMLVIILGREFLISAIRAFAESKNIAFGSSSWGQHKMTIQSITIIAALAYLRFFLTHQTFWVVVTLKVLFWLTLATTIISGMTYIFYSRKIKQLES
jgi:CDP-diacylglycerol--glycerol-3-phosphate 3-phosphatidyltransferase